MSPIRTSGKAISVPTDLWKKYPRGASKTLDGKEVLVPRQKRLTRAKVKPVSVKKQMVLVKKPVPPARRSKKKTSTKSNLVIRTTPTPSFNFIPPTPVPNTIVKMGR